MFNDRPMLYIIYESKLLPSVSVGDGKRAFPAGVGRIRCNTVTNRTENKIELKNVFLVPELI